MRALANTILDLLRAKLTINELFGAFDPTVPQRPVARYMAPWVHVDSGHLLL
jgi:hypothetical protein